MGSLPVAARLEVDGRTVARGTFIATDCFRAGEPWPFRFFVLALPYPTGDHGIDGAQHRFELVHDDEERVIVAITGGAVRGVDEAGRPAITIDGVAPVGFDDVRDRPVRLHVVEDWNLAAEAMHYEQPWREDD